MKTSMVGIALSLTLLCLFFAFSTNAQNGNNTSGPKPSPTPTPVPHPTPTPTPPLVSKTGAFKILVDINQLQPSEAGNVASLFAADGIWAITINSPVGINWPATFAALNAVKWTVSEENTTATTSVDLVSGYLGYLLNDCMSYLEGPGLTDTVLSPAQINAYASHV